MELNKMTKIQLLMTCDELGITKCKTKNKSELINLINSSSSNNNSSSNNISPLRYPGGKTRACKIIDNIITEHFDISQFDTLCSPFFGGGSFEFYFQNKYNHKLIVNDKFTPLYNFWQQIKTNKHILCDELTKITSVSKAQFINYRDTIMELNDDMLQQSIQYFIINRCSFSGATLSGGFSAEASLKRYTPSSINKIKLLDFTNIAVYNFDFEYFINSFTTSG
jgi:DNA adenine methylase